MFAYREGFFLGSNPVFPDNMLPGTKGFPAYASLQTGS